MPKINNFIIKYKQYNCSHACDINSMIRISDENINEYGRAWHIEATCWKCNKILSGLCGLDLKCIWLNKEK